MGSEMCIRDSNKIVAAVLMVALLVIGIGKLSNVIFHVEKPKTPGYAVEVEQATIVSSSTEKVVEEKVDIAALMAMGDITLGGFAINGVNLTKLQSYPEKNTFDSYFFLCDLDGHIENPKVQKSLEELGLHCEDFHVLGVFEADNLREKKK